MGKNQDKNKDSFLYLKSKYRGKFTPQNLVFDANLQEFAQKILIISSLEANGKISPLQAYREIKSLWRELKQSKKKLFDIPNMDE